MDGRVANAYHVRRPVGRLDQRIIHDRGRIRGSVENSAVRAQPKDSRSDLPRFDELTML